MVLIMSLLRWIPQPLHSSVIAGASVQQPPPDIVSGDVDLTASVEKTARKR